MSDSAHNIFHELGDASFYMNDYHFSSAMQDGICVLKPQPAEGQGVILQFQSEPGLFISASEWIPALAMERRYEIPFPLVKMYYLESGEVTLIQNGKRAQPISRGVNLYLNRPGHGRVLYEPDVPISYVSVLLFEDYMTPHFQTPFSASDFDCAEIYDWQPFNYNTPEIARLFSQLKSKLFAGETSRLYYESKVGELLALVAANFHQENARLSSPSSLSPQEQKAMAAVRRTIEQNIYDPPSLDALCQLAAMGQTKLRETFRAAYGVPLTTYIRQTKMRVACMLLSTQTLSISDIAHRLGYANVSKFSAAFRKIVGQSPAEYRRAQKNS